MNIKLQLSEVRLLIDKRFPIEQIGSQLQPIARQANLIFAEHQVGAGYLQWSLPGMDWNAFPNGSDEQKTIVAQIYKERKAQMQSALQGSFLKDIVFSVPSEEFIFFRQDGDLTSPQVENSTHGYPGRIFKMSKSLSLGLTSICLISVSSSLDIRGLPRLMVLCISTVRFPLAILIK